MTLNKSGAMGTVFRATDRLNGETVALKRVNIATDQLEVVTRTLVNDSDQVRHALAAEFRTLASLRHPHIISVLDYGFDAQSVACFSEADIDRALALWQWAQAELAQGDATKGKAMWQEAHAIFARLDLPLFVAQMEAAAPL